MSSFRFAHPPPALRPGLHRRFSEELEFNIPLHPLTSLTGEVVLTRDKDTGLITKYREIWDQSVHEVLKSAKFRL